MRKDKRTLNGKPTLPRRVRTIMEILGYTDVRQLDALIDANFQKLGLTRTKFRFSQPLGNWPRPTVEQLAAVMKDGPVVQRTVARPAPTFSFMSPYHCSRCGRSMTHVFARGYICQVCEGIDDY